MRRVPMAPELVAARVLAQADILRRCVGCQDGSEADCHCAGATSIVRFIAIASPGNR
jgi:hypothetical protein